MTINSNKAFKRQYRKLPPKTKAQFLARLELFKTNPGNPLLKQHPLKGQLAGYYSINISGDFRAIFKRRGQRITFVLVGTHSQLYR